MVANYRSSQYYVDFSKRSGLNTEQKKSLEHIQKTMLPMERGDLLTEYRQKGMITDDDYTQMTGIPFTF